MVKPTDKVTIVISDITRRTPITTNSGYPLDTNFYQAGKGLSAARLHIN